MISLDMMDEKLLFHSLFHGFFILDLPVFLENSFVDRVLERLTEARYFFRLYRNPSSTNHTNSFVENFIELYENSINL